VCHFTHPKNALWLKGFDARDFVAELREVSVTPHLAQNTSGRRSAINGRTTRHPGYAVSQRIRKVREEAFRWTKTVGGLRKARNRGLPKIDWQFHRAVAASGAPPCRTVPRSDSAGSLFSSMIASRSNGSPASRAQKSLTSGLPMLANLCQNSTS